MRDILRRTISKYLEVWRNFDKMSYTQKDVWLVWHVLVPPALYYTINDVLKYLPKGV